MMTDEAQPPSSSSSDPNIPPPEPDPPPNIKERMLSPTPSQASQPQPIRSRVQSAGTSEEQSSSSSCSATPPWLKWSRGLTSLLDDQQGRDLFERYLDQEGCSAQLNFLWACEGLKCTASEDPPKIPPLVRSIHRHFFQNNVLLGISETTRSDLAQAIIDGKFHEVGLFDKAEEEVQTHMQENLYPNFLKSEIYLCAVNGEDEVSTNLQEQLEQSGGGESSSLSGRKSSVGEVSSGEGSGNGGGSEEQLSKTTALAIDVEQKSGSEGQSPKIPSPPLSTAPSVLLPNQLQTVPEDKVLSVNSQAAANQHNSKVKLALTKEALQFTQRTRASVPAVGSTNKVRSREGFTGHFHPKASNPSTSVQNPYHASYSSYNPVSRVDSEIQSMSSDAMTDDGAHSGHGHSSGRKHGAHHHGGRSKNHQIPSSSSSHLHLHQGVHSSCESRRQNLHSGVHLDNRDNLPKFPPGIVKGAQRAPNREAELDPNVFAATLIRKLEEVKRQREIEEQLHQRISEVDDHVGMPYHAGGAVDETRNVLAAAITRLQVQDEPLPDDILDKHMSRVFSDITPDNRSPKLRSPTAGRRRGGPSVASMRPRRDRDVVSMLSIDSGNVHDYASDTLPSISKSRSIPTELRVQDLQGEFTSGGVFGAPQRGRLARGGGLGHGDSRNVPLAFMPKRTSTEFLDSGISVVSGATPTVISVAAQPPPLPCDRTDLRVAQWMEQSMDDRQNLRRLKKPVLPPHVTAHSPSTPILEEARRRLTKMKTTSIPTTQVPVGPSSSGSLGANLPSSSSHRHHSPPSSDESSSATNKEHYIPSFVRYEDSTVPFIVKIPCKTPSTKPGNGSPETCGITLAVFKEYIPKRGNFRYFFQRKCSEVYQVVQEEITDDFQELPLFEGKIIARLEAAVGESRTAAT